MKKTGSIIKKIRKKRNMTQSEVAKGILSRQTYSKLERNLSEPAIDIFIHLLNRLNYSFPDFINEMEDYTTQNYYHDVYLKALKNEIPSEEALKLYNYANDTKENDTNSLYFYGRVTGHLHKLYPTIIPEFSDADKQLFRTYILSLGKEYSLYDLRVIADFSALSLQPQELGELYDNLPEFSPINYAYDISSYHLLICKLHNNFCDIFLAYNDLKRAKISNDKLDYFLKQRMNLRYAFYKKINEITLNYLTTNNEKILQELLDIADYLEYIGDLATANAARYQYKTYLNKEQYRPENAFTPDN